MHSIFRKIILFLSLYTNLSCLNCLSIHFAMEIYYKNVSSSSYTKRREILFLIWFFHPSFKSSLDSLQYTHFIWRFFLFFFFCCYWYCCCCFCLMLLLLLMILMTKWWWRFRCSILAPNQYIQGVPRLRSKIASGL